MTYKLQDREWLRFTIQISGTFDPAIINQLWLKEHNLIGDEENIKLQNSIFTETGLSFETLLFKFQCNTNTMRVDVKTFEASNVADSFLKGILSLLVYTRLKEAFVVVSSHLVSSNEEKVTNFFDSFSNVKYKDSLKVESIEDYSFWSNGNNVMIGRCPSDANHLFMTMTSRKKFNESSHSTKKCIDFLNENDNFRNDSISYIVNLKEIIS